MRHDFTLKKRAILLLLVVLIAADLALSFYSWNLASAQSAKQELSLLTVNRDLDTRGWLEGVTNFSFHKHLPHYAITTESDSIRVLGRQPIDLAKPHPFTEAGNREFNSFVWMPPQGNRGGEVLLADSTIFSTLFGADDSLKRFWRNLAIAK